MKTFLEHVASSLIEKYGNNLSALTVVFPGKRASLFLNQALAEASDKPVWAPHYRTISELFVEASPYDLCDKIESVCRLHRAYAAHVAEPQTLDQFYAWGEVLLADFDDIDKQLVDARQLFTNIKDIRQLDTLDYLTPEQEEALKHFFSGFSIENTTLLRERFLELWNVMFDIYTDFRLRMQADGVLYEGALEREVVERLRAVRFSTEADAEQALPLLAQPRTYVFVGFNVLNAVEQTLFDELQRHGKAIFYWDYDVAFARAGRGAGHEAGYFIEQNISRYGNELSEMCFDNMSRPKQITIASAASENIQARYMAEWLEENLTTPERAPKGETYVTRQTAVVMCNEQLLQPALHSLPQSITQVNVTMGFPLTDTPVYSFVMAILALHTEGYDQLHHRFRKASLRAVERHPYARLLGKEWQSELRGGAELLAFVSRLLTLVAKGVADDVLAAEAVFKAFTSINRLYDLMTCPDPWLDVNDNTLRRLLRSALGSQTVAFHGEPAVGLQLMGVLETRALDFRHLLMLSVGEGYLPKSVADNSFIPYHLRDAFGLTTLRHKIAVYAYYFYRLIARAERVTFVYNESNTGQRQNEISRFLRQLEAETDLEIRHLRLNAANRPAVTEPIVIEKTDEIMQKLIDSYDNTNRDPRHQRFLSPSALNRYTTCPLQFYYRYVKGLRVDSEPEDGFDAIIFGNVFHKAAELVYRHLTAEGPYVRQQDYDALLNDGALIIDNIVSEAFRHAYFQGRPEEYNGILVIARQVVTTYLQNLLRHDRRLAPVHILDLEGTYTKELSLIVGDGTIRLLTGGIIDRLDEVSDPEVRGSRAVRIIDYKTGGTPSTVSDIDKLFVDAGQTEHYYFQTILYATIISEQMGKPAQPCLFFVHRAAAPDYSPKLKFGRAAINDVDEPLGDDTDSLAESFTARLHMLVDEIFDPDVPFRQCADATSCHFCDYRLFCGRLNDKKN